MARIGTSRMVWVILAIALGLGGYVVGSRQGHQGMIKALQTEATGNLNQRIETLSRLRLGDVPAAITRLESEADLLTQTIALNPGADKRILAAVKTYLSVAPPSAARARILSPILEGVPTLDQSQCDSALSALLRSAKGGSAERLK